MQNKVIMRFSMCLGGRSCKYFVVQAPANARKLFTSRLIQIIRLYSTPRLSFSDSLQSTDLYDGWRPRTRRPCRSRANAQDAHEWKQMGVRDLSQSSQASTLGVATIARRALADAICSRYMNRVNRVPYYQALFQRHDGVRQWDRVSSIPKPEVTLLLRTAVATMREDIC